MNDEENLTLNTSQGLLTLLFAGDHSGVDELRDNAEKAGVDWWNVSLNYGFLLRDIFHGNASAVAIIAQTLEDADSLKENKQPKIKSARS